MTGRLGCFRVAPLWAANMQTDEVFAQAGFVRDDETAALGRQATVLKNEKNWDGAIDCLRAMQERMWVSPVHYSVDAWCRLALVLQQSGRFDESELEFKKLIESLPRLARKESFMDFPNISFGKTSKNKIYNQVIRTHTKIIKERWALAKQREDRRIAKQSKIDNQGRKSHEQVCNRDGTEWGFTGGLR